MIASKPSGTLFSKAGARVSFHLGKGEFLFYFCFS